MRFLSVAHLSENHNIYYSNLTNKNNLEIKKLFLKVLTKTNTYDIICIVAGMVKLADTRVLEARAERREGSSPFTRTIFLK